MSAVLTQPPRRVGRPPCCSPEVARRILELKDEGYSLRRTAKQLNDEALPTPMGQAKWDKSHVWRVLGTLYMRDLENQTSPGSSENADRHSELRQDMKVVKAAVTDLSREQRDLARQVPQLESA